MTVHEEGILRPSVLAFAIKMEEKLRLKDADFPNGWNGDDPWELFKRLDEEVEELYQALSDYEEGDKSLEEYLALVTEAADIANFAMMIAETAVNLSLKGHVNESLSSSGF